jgi:hypothetical protein
MTKNPNPRGEDDRKTADEGPHDDFRISTCLRRRLELLFAATLPRCETFGLAIRSASSLARGIARYSVKRRQRIGGVGIQLRHNQKSKEES